MHIDSIALQTDIFFWRATGTVTDRGEYLVVSTPASPGWYWGNLLIFDRPPGPGDFERWNDLFRHEFGDNPKIEHVLFSWPVRPGDEPAVEPFLDAAFELEPEVALTTDMVVPPPHMDPDVEVRVIEREEEWEALLEMQLRSRKERFERESFARFLRMRQAHYRGLIDAGHGHWYGAFLGDRLVGGLGLFRTNDIGRFQEVATDPDYRRRGVCGRLVHEVSRRALDEGYVRSLVMVADENYHAARIYERLGFRPNERAAALCRYALAAARLS